MTLGENITTLRTKRGMTQGELADALEMSRQSVSKWETDASVPDLDKLLRLAELFGVTLDALIKGNPLRDAAADSTAAPTAEPTGEGSRPAPSTDPVRHTQRLIGTILLCFGALIALLFLLFGGSLAGLLFGAPFFLCGTILMTVKRRAGLWCGWTMYLLVVGYLRYATGLSWQTIFQTFQWTASMNYLRLAIAWGMALFLFAMLAATLRAFRPLTIPCGRKQTALLAIGWLAAFAASWLESRWLVHFLAQHQNLTGYGWVFTLNDAFAIVLDLVTVVLLTLTAALYQSHRQKKQRG